MSLDVPKVYYFISAYASVGSGAMFRSNDWLILVFFPIHIPARWVDFYIYLRYWRESKETCRTVGFWFIGLEKKKRVEEEGNDDEFHLTT